MIYFDNAATTFPKPDFVLKATNEFLKKYCGNSGRSSHKLSIITSEKIYATREKIANFLSVDDPENIVFTQNATHALNLAIKTTVENNSHVIISNLEHNSVFRPIYALSKNNEIKYSVFNTENNIESSIEKSINKNTKYIVSTIASNVIGREVPLSELSLTAKKHNLGLIIDASQLIGHKRIDLKKTPCDVLCAPGHKALFGIQGVGFAVFLDKKKRQTFIEGGSGNESQNPEMPITLPERFEAGTLPSPSIISLFYGIEFIENIGLCNIENKLNALCEKCADTILSFKNTELFECGNGIISFNVKNIPSEIISYEFDKYGICTRSGLHCSPLAHKTLGTLSDGTVRISLSYMNDFTEIDKFYKALSDICKKYI